MPPRLVPVIRFCPRWLPLAISKRARGTAQGAHPERRAIGVESGEAQAEVERIERAWERPSLGAGGGEEPPEVVTRHDDLAIGTDAQAVARKPRGAEPRQELSVCAHVVAHDVLAALEVVVAAQRMAREVELAGSCRGPRWTARPRGRRTRPDRRCSRRSGSPRPTPKRAGLPCCRRALSRARRDARSTGRSRAIPRALSASVPFGVPSGARRAMTLGFPTLASTSPGSKPSAVAACAPTVRIAASTAAMAYARPMTWESQRPRPRGACAVISIPFPVAGTTRPPSRPSRGRAGPRGG